MIISTFGGLSIRVDEVPVTGLVSRKAEALVVYLGVTGRSQPREVLADLLWDERTQKQAASNLRTILASLRKHLGDYLTITRSYVSINKTADIWVDANELEITTHEIQLKGGVFWPSESQNLAEKINLYKGDFLSGFNISGCRDFENWMLVKREHFYQLVLAGLGELVDYFIERGEYQDGITHAQHWVQLNPIMERANRGLMRLLYFSGRKLDALAQFEVCASILRKELALDPSTETRELYNHIQNDTLEVPQAKPIHEPSFLKNPPAFIDTAVPDHGQFPTFVARQSQLHRLNGCLNKAVSGDGQVVFATGGPGRGKTALLGEFARRAMHDHPNLLAVTGRCNAYEGVGDFYLPFREIMGMLGGDVESLWQAGVISSDHARRICNTTPLVAGLVLEHGPDLLGTFLQAEDLLARVETASHEDKSNITSLRRKITNLRARQAGIEQSYLFEQFTNVLTAIAREHPLLLVVDDLQWADSSSIALLFHLARRLQGTRILVAAAYRPDEVSLGRDGQRHPLEKILAEIKLLYGDVSIDLTLVEDEENARFINELLDSQSNRLDQVFRQDLLEHTAGHPLYTIELLRSIQERGDLILDDAGYWILGSQIEWGQLPTRVEAVIEERIARLEPDQQAFLKAASVEGEEFSVQIVAGVQQLPALEAAHLLSGELKNRHRLVQEGASLSIDHKVLFRYRFSHNLIQKYLYNTISEGERTMLHGEIAMALEELAGSGTQELARSVILQLGWHFSQAGEKNKAVKYLVEAGDMAFQSHAYKEAKLGYRQALDILEDENIGRHAYVLYKLGESHARLAEYPTAEKYLDTATKLARDSGDTNIEIDSLCSLCYCSRMQGDYDRAVEYAQQSLDVSEENDNMKGKMVSLKLLGILHGELGDSGIEEECYERSLAVAREINDTGGIADCLNNLGILAHDRGDLKGAERLFHQAINIVKKMDDKWRMVYYMANFGETVWRLGRFHEAVHTFNESIEVAEQMGDSDGVAVNLNLLGSALLAFGEYDEAAQHLENGLEIARAHRLRRLEAQILTNLGYTTLETGQYEAAREKFEIAKTNFIDINCDVETDRCFLGIGRVELTQGFYDKALQNFKYCLKLAKKRGSSYFEADVLLSLGMTSWEMGNHQDANRFFQDGLDLYKTCGHQVGIAYSYAYLGLNAVSMGKIDDGKEYYRLALELSTKIDLMPAAAEALVGTAVLLFKSGENRKAVCLASFVCAQDRCSYATRHRANHLLEDLAHIMKSEIFELEKAKGNRMNLEQVLLQLEPVIAKLVH